MNEAEVARAIAAGELSSPQKFGNSFLVALRISGSGLADRPALGERVFRDPKVWLSDETVARVAGLPVVLDHPEGATLDADEYAARSVGAILFGYVADRDGIENQDGPDLWGVCRAFIDDALVAAIADKSTSPGVAFKSSDGNTTITLDDGTRCLCEAAPTLIDHVAIVTHGSGAGVWDKGLPNSGLRFDSKGTTDMTDEETKAAEAKEREERARKDAEEKSRKDAEHEGTQLDKILKHLDSMGSRLDALEKGGRKDATGEGGEGGEGEDGAELAAKRKDKARKDAAAEREEETALADAQHRADAVYQAFGQRAAMPMQGEKPIAFRRRMLRPLLKHSAAFSDVDIAAINDATLLSAIETKVYSDAMVASATPDVPEGKIMERVKTDPMTGRRTHEFFGRGTFIGQMKRPARMVTAINRQPGIATA
jgi:colicin import membrane protein